MFLSLFRPARMAAPALAALLALGLPPSPSSALTYTGDPSRLLAAVVTPGPGEAMGADRPDSPHLVQMRHIERLGRDAMPDILVLYPSIGRPDVDEDIRLWIEHIADTFEADFSRPPAGIGRGSLSGGWMTDPSVFSLSSTCHVTFPSAYAVSVTFELWMYTGAEHPGQDVITLNYSLITGQRLALVDLFEDVDTALALMSRICRAELSHRVGHGQVGRQLAYGTEPVPENFSSLELTTAGVRVHFQPYQVASWEAGVQSVDIPLESLAAARPLLNLWGRYPLVNGQEEPAGPAPAAGAAERAGG